MTNNTMFHKTIKPLQIWLHAIWWMIAQKNGVSEKGLQKVLGLWRYRTAWTWLKKFRRLMVLSIRSKLEGIVEVHEVLIGGKTSGKLGRGAEGKSLIAVAGEVKGRKTGSVKLEKIPDATGKSLISFIERNIETSLTIFTDGWSGYSVLEKMGYIHKVQKSLVREDDEEILPNVHRIASLLKRWLFGTHQSYLNKNQFGYYLDEYVFRYNRRTSNSRGSLFLRILEQAVAKEPVSHDKIINENHRC